MLKVAFLIGCLATLATPSMAANFDLICDGGGTYTVADTDVGTAQNSNGQSATATVTHYSQANYQSQVNVHISDGDSKILVPHDIVPTINYGGKSGWWPLSKTEVSENEITAEFSLNFIRKYKVRIDRITGKIFLQGSSNFTGQCKAYDPQAIQRQF